MNLVDVDPTSSSKAVFWRNVVSLVVGIGGSLALIAAIYWYAFGW